jgi:hypothetical protein
MTMANDTPDAGRADLLTRGDVLDAINRNRSNWDEDTPPMRALDDAVFDVRSLPTAQPAATSAEVLERVKRALIVHEVGASVRGDQAVFTDAYRVVDALIEKARGVAPVAARLVVSDIPLTDEQRVSLTVPNDALRAASAPAPAAVVGDVEVLAAVLEQAATPIDSIQAERTNYTELCRRAARTLRTTEAARVRAEESRDMHAGEHALADERAREAESALADERAAHAETRATSEKWKALYKDAEKDVERADKLTALGERDAARRARVEAIGKLADATGLTFTPAERRTDIDVVESAIVALRKSGDNCALEADAARCELEEVRSKKDAMGKALTSAEKELALAVERLVLVRTPVRDVWCWQGDGGDDPPSLSCPVIMSADTLRALVAKATPASFGEEWDGQKLYDIYREGGGYAESMERVARHVEARVGARCWQRFEALARTEGAVERAAKAQFARVGTAWENVDEATRKCWRGDIRAGIDALLASVRERAGVAGEVVAGEPRGIDVKELADACTRAAATAGPVYGIGLAALAEEVRRAGGGR